MKIEKLMSISNKADPRKEVRLVKVIKAGEEYLFTRHTSDFVGCDLDVDGNLYLWTEEREEE